MHIKVFTKNKKTVFPIMKRLQKEQLELKVSYQSALAKLHNEPADILFITDDRLTELSETVTNRFPLVVACTQPLSEKEKIVLFQKGVNILWSWPVSFELMKAKVESLRSALLKQKQLKNNTQPVYQKFQVLEEKQVILLHEKELSLTKSEYRLFGLLLNHPLRIFSREELLILLGNEEGSGRVIDTHIKNIRKKIEEVAGSVNYIQTVHGRGYRFTNATH